MSRWRITWEPASPRRMGHLGIAASVIGVAAIVAPQLLLESGMSLPPIVHMVVRVLLAVTGMGMALSALSIGLIIGSGYRWPTVNRLPSIHSGRVGQ